LPHKFNVDKRRVHLSTLIISRQLSREDALMQLNDKPYPSARDLAEDIHYFLKKMNWSRDQLDAYILAPEIRHDVYPSEINTWRFLGDIKKKFIKC
jgi:hypothetical protein